jgi:hypothetical protein
VVFSFRDCILKIKNILSVLNFRFLRLQVVAEMQKTETKNSKAKDVFEKVKTDIRLMKEELNLIDR